MWVAKSQRYSIAHRDVCLLSSMMELDGTLLVKNTLEDEQHSLFPVMIIRLLSCHTLSQPWASHPWGDAHFHLHRDTLGRCRSAEKTAVLTGKNCSQQDLWMILSKWFMIYVKRQCLWALQMYLFGGVLSTTCRVTSCCIIFVRSRQLYCWYLPKTWQLIKTI